MYLNKLMYQNVIFIKSFINLFWKIYKLKTGDTEKYNLNSNGSFFATSKTIDADHLGKFTQKILAHSKN